MQPKFLIVGRKHGRSFDPGEPERYRKDVPDAEVHELDAGHFAQDTGADEPAVLIRDFMMRQENSVSEPDKRRIVRRVGGDQSVTLTDQVSLRRLEERFADLAMLFHPAARHCLVCGGVLLRELPTVDQKLGVDHVSGSFSATFLVLHSIMGILWVQKSHEV